MSIIKFDGVYKTFDDKSGTVHAVSDVSLEIEPGEIFGVIGFSGAGKSTLVRLINGLERTSSGTIVVDGHEVSSMSEEQLRSVRPDIGMIFQQFNLLTSKTIAENVAYPLRLAKWPKERREARVKELLAFVGLADKAKAYPAQLSGGQKQRVGIARALASGPKILLADECTSALDPQTTDEVLDLLRRANRELGLTIVIITHEMDVVRYLCDRVLIMENGHAIEIGTVYDIFSRPQHPTTVKFVRNSLRDRPTDEVLERLAENHQGRFVTLTVRDDASGGDEVARIFEDHSVSQRLVYGSIREISQKPHGSLTYSLRGDDAAIDAALAELGTITEVEEHHINPQSGENA